MTIAEFTIILPIVGGMLIGLSVTLLLWLNGRIAGVSGILFSVLETITKFEFKVSEQLWRILFVLGLVVGAALFHLFSGVQLPHAPNASMPIVIIGGLLVGFGTKLGSGCTSGHGICGIARFSVRSVLSTGIFMAVGVATVFVFRSVLGWS